MQSLNISPNKFFDAFCVIPVYDERLEALMHFIDYQSSKNIALILVVNAPESAEPGALSRTRELLRQLKSRYSTDELAHSLYCADVSKTTRLYLFDRCSSGNQIPDKQGVGLARKLGMDLAVYLSSWQENEVWIHCCDADVQLPDGYFDIAPPKPRQSAAVYAFRHIAESGYEEAMAFYDFKLHYYQFQLASAGSPYAFFTIGSTIAVTPLAYVQVRGMPKRSGGEDFYFLNKLAKVGEVVQLDKPVLTIAGRPSHRVPFGTGPALTEIKQLANASQEYRFYHPDIFAALKNLLEVANQPENYQSLERFINALNEKGAEESLKIMSALNALGFTEKFPHIRGGKTSEQLQQRFHTWFDAFITLKFVHFMRDTDYSSVRLDDLPDHVKVAVYQKTGNGEYAIELEQLSD